MDRKKLIVGAATVAILALGGGGIAYATGGDGGEQATGPNIEKAKSAALAHTNGGRVSGTEVGDEEGYYVIEVTRDDGSQADVHLDLNVLGTVVDHETQTTRTGPTTTSVRAAMA